MGSHLASSQVSDLSGGNTLPILIDKALQPSPQTCLRMCGSQRTLYSFLLPFVHWAYVASTFTY